MNITISKKSILFLAFLFIFIFFFYQLKVVDSWDYMGDATFYLKSAINISQSFNPIERLFRLDYIVGNLNIPHILYPILLSYTYDITQNYTVFALQLTLFLLAICQLNLLLHSYNVKLKYFWSSLIIISSGLIYWSAMPMKEALLCNLYLLYYRLVFIVQTPLSIKRPGRLGLIALCLTLIGMTRFWYPLYLLIITSIAFIASNFYSIIRKLRVSKSMLTLVILFGILGLRSLTWMTRVTISPYDIIASIIKPNPLNLLGTPFSLYIPSTIVFKLLLLYTLYVAFYNLKAYLFTPNISFLAYNYIFNAIFLSGSVLTGERHKFIALLSLSLCLPLTNAMNRKEKKGISLQQPGNTKALSAPAPQCYIG